VTTTIDAAGMSSFQFAISTAIVVVTSAFVIPSQLGIGGGVGWAEGFLG